MYEKIWILLGAVVVLLFIPQMKVYAAKSSRIETVDYTTIYQGKTYHKQAYVYLPENYNKNQNYNILYLTHGYSMGAQDLLNKNIVNQLNYNIRNGQIKPQIIVSVTYYPSRSFVPDNYEKDVTLNRYFAKVELQKYLMPAIEGRYNTYASTNTTKGYIDSRKHRAFGGFSMGAITTWFVLEYDLKYFSEFVPMAGDSWTVENDGGGIAPKATAQKLAKAITKQEYKENDFSIYASVGSDDGTRFSMSPQIKSMWKLAIFNQDNLQYWLDKGGNHNMASVIKQLIHAEKQLFKER